MRFGFGAIPDGSIDDSVRLAVLGEELGFDVFWVPDQTFYSDPFVVLAACARATQRIGLMLGVANPFTRHPVQIARAGLTLDELSNGRMMVGYGAGNGDELVLRIVDEHRDIAARCREAVQVTRRLLRGETLDHISAAMHLDRVRLIAPARPGIPVYLGGRSPLILEAAGADADGVIIGSIASPAGLHYALETVRAGADTSGRSLDGVEIVSWAGVHLTDGSSGATSVMKPIVANVMAGHRTPAWVLRTVGLSAERIEQVRSVYLRDGKLAAARRVTDAEVSLFAHVGDAKGLRRRFEELEEIGVGQIGILVQQPGLPAKESFLRSFAQQVIGPMRSGR